MDYRVEKKYLCTEAQLRILEQRLACLMKPDTHQSGGRYSIRSIYLDTLDDRMYYESEAGLAQRSKYRIRTYNNDPATLHMEIKAKRDGYCRKWQCPLTEEERNGILHGRPPMAGMAKSTVMARVCRLMLTEGLRPAAVISYERTAYVERAGNVRITFDRNITAGRDFGAFYAEHPAARPILPTGQHILEVKYDEFLPAPIAQVLELGNLQQTTFSKYYLGRKALDY